MFNYGLFKNKWTVAMLLLAGFAYGVAVGRYQLFPYYWIEDIIPIYWLKSLKQSLRTSEQVELIETNQLVLRKRILNSKLNLNATGEGGGITAIGDTIYGVDHGGHFFLFRDGVSETLQIELDNKRIAFTDYASGISGSRSSLLRFRFYDLLFHKRLAGWRLYVSYTYWKEDEQCIQNQLAYVDLQGEPGHYADDLQIIAQDWHVLYATRPCLPVLDDGRGLSNRTGGRIALDSNGKLLLSVGDFRFDGHNRAQNYPQNNKVSYGKLLRIDPDSEQVEIVAYGLRNPQGLYIDNQQRIWLSGHGPIGGDELNLVTGNNNFGWPMVSYGTTEDHVWPLSESPGFHSGYQLPVFAWVPSIGVSNLIQVAESPVQWQGDFLLASLNEHQLFRLRIREQRVIFAEPVFIGSRIRDLEQLTDGRFILWTDDGTFIELTAQAYPQQQLTFSAEDQANGLPVLIQQCRQCHTFSGSKTAAQIDLRLVYQRKIAAQQGVRYSDGLKSKSGVWQEETLRAFLMNPGQFAERSRMPDPGLSQQQASLLIDYLKRLKEP